MGKKINFIYVPSIDKEIEEEKVQQAKLLIAEFLVKKALEKTANNC